MGGVEATIRLPDVEAHVLRAHGRRRALTPAEEDVLVTWGDALREYIVARWPVDTGTSRDLWEVEVSVSPGEYGMTIINDASYAEWVHPAGDDSGPMWEWLVPEAWSVVKPALVAELVAAVDRTEAELRRREATRRRDVLDVYRRPLGIARGAA